MTDELDDDLGIDLDAWRPPSPSPGVADGVIARMRREVTAQVSATPVEVPVKRRRWVIGIAAGTALVASGVASIALGVERPPADGRGSVAASVPQHLAIGPTSAELDPGTTVEWRRERYRVTAKQGEGAATWRVDDDDTLTIDATVATIEASNASLRVEVEMNEKQTVATSAITAAAVALATIVVYDGTVRVRTDDKTVTIPAGTTYRVSANQNVVEEAATVGANFEQLKQEIARLERERGELLAKLEARTVVAKSPCDDVNALVERGRAAIAAGAYARALGPLEAAYRCRPEQATQRLQILALCKLGDVSRARTYYQQLGDRDMKHVMEMTCANNGIMVAVASGKLLANSTPAAELLIDGRRVGRTPVKVELTPGKHKVTFLVGADKHTFAVSVKAGETVTLNKQLR